MSVYEDRITVQNEEQSAVEKAARAREAAIVSTRIGIRYNGEAAAEYRAYLGLS